MKSFPLFLTLMVLVLQLITSQKTIINTRINTEQIYRSVNIQSDQIYSIDVIRVGSSMQTQGSRCHSIPRHIDIGRKQQIFRLSKGQDNNRQQKVYEKLISLNEQQNIIQEFQIIGDRLFLITTQGDGYFIALNNTQTISKLKTNFFNGNQNSEYVDFIVIKDYKERAVIIGKNNIVMCKPERQVCDILEGFEKLDSFRGAELYQYNGKSYIFLITSDTIVIYELTANGKLKDKKILDKVFFKAQKISLRGLYKTDNNKIIVLDDLRGLREISSNDGLATFQLKNQSLYDQFGCYQLIGQDNGETLVLACAPSLNTYFILKLMKSRQFAEPIYEPLQTVFIQEKLYQVDSVENMLLSRVFSGVKLYWSSKQLGNPYPYFHRKAGSLFLHNAIQAKLKNINGMKKIYLAAEDELLIYELNFVEPSVSCYSPNEVSQQYKIKYNYPCEQSFMLQENVCSSQQQLTLQVWEHKELKVMSVLVPFFISLLGVIAVIFAIRKIYNKYNTDIECARLKYNVQDNQLDN